ncbi:MAG TPA: N-formylglutamate amidohydrolase [Candidatus Sulfotelmatobacter sp.]|nr:N-formylglutamate amidohydrolase [Candidatus Sulfotelmatobacter sp.]
MSEPLLQPGDPDPVRVVNPDGRAPLLLVCDHASDAIPRCLGGLGVGPRELVTHIAYDIGAAAVAEGLSAAFDAPLVTAGFSRLVIDCNRVLDAPTSIPPVSDAVPIPGNRDLAPAARTQRVAALFTPYHRAIDARLDAMAARGASPCFLAVHSCTPVFSGFRRPWHFGVLWNRDGRLAEPLIAELARDGMVCVGDNQPYSGRDGHGYTLPTHAEARGLPHATVEIRQDLIGDAAGVARWTRRLAEALAPVVAALTGWRAA